jgi:outer membrane receptor protein involved in Fe transport
VKRLRNRLAVGAAVLAATASPALAQEDDPGITDIEVPTLVLDDGVVEGDGEEGDDIDLANIVQSAARAVTTVQEAPAIVTVITSDEIEERHAQTLSDLIDPVPGYMRAGLIHSQFPQLSARGQVQAFQLLHDSVSMFEPFVNIATVTPVQPMELIKRVELITGPGGVLWGSNSMVGIANVITKDAEDVDGVEVGVTGGHGNGNREYLHGYVMAGKEDVFGKDDVKALVHGSFKTYHGAGFEMAQQRFSAPLPQPNSPVLYGPMTQADPPMSFLFTSFAKLTWGKTQLRIQIPYYERQTPIGFPGVVIRQDDPQDSLPECQQDLDMPIVMGDGCYDKLKKSRTNRPDFYDRYAVLEYRTRMANGKAGVSAKAYVQQFVRDFEQLQILTPIESLLEGGLAFKFDATTYRLGSAIDGDVELPANTRLLYGVEAFHEFALNDVERARQGDGIEATFLAPYELGRLPLPCPRERFIDPDTNMPTVRIMEGCPLTFAFPSSRTVFGAYASPQWRPTKKLILDGGARVQVAPEALGENFYDPTVTFGASAVYNFLPNWHAKANFTQGFRPPVFNNLNSNGEAVQLDGARDIKVETSDAVQGEVNARLFKGERRIRELNFRLDYSYTRIQNLIQVQSGRYLNTADRGINSVEFLGKLYVQGGHRFELGYTWLSMNTADKGHHRAAPEHWFHLLGVFNVIDDRLQATTAVRVIGAQEDANRIVEHRGIRYCSEEDAASPIGCRVGDVINEMGQTVDYVTTQPSDLVLDRIPPTGELMLGLTWVVTPSLVIRGEAFNVLNGRFYQPDLFFDYEPRLEFLPNPFEDFRAYVGATYSY